MSEREDIVCLVSDHGHLHRQAAATVRLVCGELEDCLTEGREEEGRGEADVARPDELGPAPPVPPPGQEDAPHLPALAGAPLLGAVRLKEDLHRPQVGFPAQERSVDGVDQESTGTGWGQLTSLEVDADGELDDGVRPVGGHRHGNEVVGVLLGVEVEAAGG